jgi:hypothetical protein
MVCVAFAENSEEFRYQEGMHRSYYSIFDFNVQDRWIKKFSHE